jgi:hypothetical protein
MPIISSRAAKAEKQLRNRLWHLMDGMLSGAHHLIQPPAMAIL